MPYYSFQLDVPFPPEEVVRRLQRLVRYPPPGFLQTPKFLSPDDGNYFAGKIEGHRFRLQRIISGRNSFLPQVRGRISTPGGGTQVRVTMFMHPLVYIFMLFWLSIVGSVAATAYDAGGQNFWGPLAMFLFGLVLMLASFFPEAFRAKRLISSAVLNTADEHRTKQTFTT